MAGNSKITYDGKVLIDISNDTVTPQTLAKGYTAHNSNGEQIVGTMTAEGGGGSGIIDVTELPTSNIDENAVYRVTKSIQTEKTEIYILASGVVTLQQHLTSLGVPTKANMYVVDELPADMLITDVQTFSAIHLYILKSDGIVYANVPVYGGIITIGLFSFQAMGYDKGFTKNIYNEYNAGVYTTLEAYKQIIRWFIRENGEWKEITAHSNSTTPHGYINAEVYAGDITSRVFGIGDILNGEDIDADENWFISRSGTPVKRIKDSFFQNSGLKTVILPSYIEYVGVSCFDKCKKLETVTFKSKPKTIYTSTFNDCDNLTTINVPWSEGEVNNAPWGATNATINYNYTEG